MTKYLRNAQKAFASAIRANILSSHKTRFNYAGHYMYMHSTAIRSGPVDVFKHILSRQYISVPITA